MDTRVGRPFRQGIVAGVFALSLLAGIGVAAHAAEIDKGAFKTGCESGGGSYVENADGSFQCNTKSGGTIKCPDTKSQCVSIPRVWIVDTGVIVTLPQGGVMQALAEGNTGGSGDDAGDNAGGQSTEGQAQDQAGGGSLENRPTSGPDQGQGKNEKGKDQKGKKHKKGLKKIKGAARHR